MKKQNNQLRQTILLAAIAAIFLLGASHSAFTQGIGAPYAARDPRTCADKTLPKTGAPSAAKATEYVICSAEAVNVYLYLVEDVKVQVSKGRPYNIREDINVPNIDIKVLVYPIRGSYKRYSCDPTRPDRTNYKRNCTIYTAPNATGLCYKDTFGDWHCGMTDARTGDYTDRDVPPPGGAIDQPKDEKTVINKNQQNKDTQQAENKTAENKDENGFPKPDFSALEKWYDIVRYEYQPLEQKLSRQAEVL